MFTIKVDGRVLYDPALFDEQFQVINPELTLEVNKAGSLTFTMPPCNAMWGSLNKLTSIITVEQDGLEIFRGRVMNEETDTWKQRSVYVEGELAFLLDSIQRPYEFSGNAVDLFRQLITNHNESVNAEKRFSIGRITAVDETTEAAIDASGHSDTFTEINDRLLNAYGGYIRIRHEEGTSFIDYLSESGDNNTQPIQLGVNLLDLKESISAEDVFTVLIPTGALQNGADGKFSELLKISEANNGLDYLEDAEAIAKYGRIWKRKHWDAIEDPQQLKEVGKKYLATGIAEDATLTITAVDMHFVDPETQRIAIGDMVQILSDPHGLDRVTICYKIVMPLQEPEKTVYTFGEPKRTLTDNVVRVEEATGGGGGGGGRTTEEEVQDVIRWAYAQADEENARYNILTGEINNLEGRTSTAEIRLNGVEATIQLKADQEIVDEYGSRLSQAEIAIDGANAAIAMKADQSTVTEYGQRLSAAEVAIDGANAAIALKADQTTVNDLSARLSQAEIDIDGANAAINLKASQTTVDALGERVGAAEIAIDGANSTIALKADKIDLQGYTTLTDFEALKGEVENLFASDLIVHGGLSANVVVAGEGDFDNLVFGTIAGENVGSQNLIMGSLVSTTVWSAGNAIDLSHSHKVTVNDDGTITLGEVSAEGGNFKIADTKAYKDGVSAAYGNGYNVGFADGKDAYLPTVISRTGYSTADKTVTVRAANSHQDLLTGQVIDASEIYDAGYSGGQTAGANGVTLSKSWSSGILTVSASNGKSSTAQLAKGTESWSNNTVSVPVLDGSGNTGYTISVDASARYNAGYSAGNGAGYNTGYAAGKDAYNPTAITRTGYSVANKNVTVKASNSHQDLLTGKTVDATEIYNGGWNACIDACEGSTALYRITQDLSSTTFYYADGTAAGTGFVRVARVYNTYFIPDKI